MQFKPTGNTEQPSNDRQNAKSFKHQEKQDAFSRDSESGMETHKQAATHRVIITIERDPKHRKSNGHSVKGDQGRNSREDKHFVGGRSMCKGAEV